MVSRDDYEKEDSRPPWMSIDDESMTAFPTSRHGPPGPNPTTDRDDDNDDDDFTSYPYPTGSINEPPQFASSPTWTKHWPPDTLSTSTYPTNTPYSDHLQTAGPTIVSEGTPLPSPTHSNGLGPGLGEGGNAKGVNRGALYAAAGIVPIVALIAVGVVVFCCMRKKKQKRQQVAAAQAQLDEMKMRNQHTMRAYIAPPSPQPSYTAPPSHPPLPSLTTPQPVILGPITGGGSNGAYFTGIDTSDMVSVTNERTGLGDPFADGNSLQEEPPPPYRPRSIAPLSRDTSLRVPESSSRTNLIDRQHEAVQSPFDDPDDDVVSHLSGPTLQRDQDAMSAVSDLSYQADPVVARPNV